MMNRILCVFLGSLGASILLFIVGCSDEETVKPTIVTKVNKQVIRVGSISDDPLNSMRKFQGFVDHLNEVYSDSDYWFEANMARDVEDAVRLIKDQEIQVFIDSPLAVYHTQKNAPISVELLMWKKQEREYSSVIYTLKGQGIDHLKDLIGKRVGFEDSWSSSSYFLPRFHIESSGLETVETEIEKPFSDPNKVGYVFSEDDETTLVWVLVGKLDAGATNTKELLDLAGEDLDKLKILAETQSIPRHVVAMHHEINPELSKSLISHMLKMHENPSYGSVLAGFSNTKQFEAIEDREALKQSMLEILNKVEI